MSYFVLALTLLGLFGSAPTPTPALKAAVAAMPTLPPRPKPESYENCEKALDQLRKYCEDSYPDYCESKVPKR